MVNRGPSKGCISCKTRRKQCDETRPSCLRCIKANRVCHGYETNTSTAFKQYEVQSINQASSAPSAARKCSLPMRLSIPGTNVLPEDAIPVERTQEESDWLSFRAFLYDFCIVSTNSNLSRGYLSDIEVLVRRLGPASDLVKACQVVSFGCHGKTLRRPNLVRKAERFYQEILGSFAKTMDDPNLVNATESRLVAMLLGLYQISATTESNHGEHFIHANGLAALLKIGKSPFDLFGTMGSHIDQDTGFTQKFDVFSALAFSDNRRSLGDLLLDLNLMWTKFDLALAGDDLYALKDAVVALDCRFIDWKKSRIPEIQPTTIGRVDKSHHTEDVSVGFWPGVIDTYFDLCVAGVWNIFRAARLLLSILAIKLCGATGDIKGCAEYTVIATEVAEDIAASIPYHLTDNLHVFINELPTSSKIGEPGRLLGGLLLMHPLYVVTQMPFLPEKLRDYTQRCLEWIGSDMGIGQATLLATVRGLCTQTSSNFIKSIATDV